MPARSWLCNEPNNSPEPARQRHTINKSGQTVSVTINDVIHVTLQLDAYVPGKTAVCYSGLAPSGSIDPDNYRVASALILGAIHQLVL